MMYVFTATSWRLTAGVTASILLLRLLHLHACHFGEGVTEWLASRTRNREVAGLSPAVARKL
jgi:hypothetical protein